MKIEMQSIEEMLALLRSNPKLVLQSVDGQGKDNEVLAFGDDDTEDLQNNGNELFKELF